MFSDTDSVGEYKTGGKSLTAIKATVRISQCFKSVLGMTLNCIRWESRGSGTERCYPLPSLQPVRLPIKGASRAAIARGFGLDTILGEQNTASKPPGKQPQSIKHIIFFPLTAS